MSIQGLYFLIRLFVFLLYYMCSLYILDINPFLELSFVNIFSHYISCLFLLFMVSFSVQKLFSLMKSHSFTFSFISLAVGVKFTKTPMRPNSINLVPMFSSMYFIVSHLVSKSLLHFELFFAWYRTPVLFHSFACSFPDFPTPFIEDIIFSPCIFGSFVENQLPMYGALNSVPLVCFLTISQCFDYCSFVTQLEVGDVVFLALFFFLKIVLAIWDLCHPTEIWIFFALFLWNMPLGF